MKYFFPLILISVFLFFCSEHNKTDVKQVITTEQKIIPAKSTAINTIEGDPSFVVSKDTVSVFGPNNITRSILQDRNGNIWFASWQGLIRYDGKFFTNVTLKEGLRRFHVFSLLEDREGNIWFGTVGGGVYRFDGRSFIYFTKKDGLAGNSVMCMMEDKSGNIWFGTDKGISCFDPSASMGSGKKIFTNITEKDGLINDFVCSMIQDNEGKLWFGTRGGVDCYYSSPSATVGKRTFTKFAKPQDSPFGNVQGMIKDRKGNIWFSNQNGLFRYDGKTSTNISKNGASYIFEDKAGNLWLNASVVNDHGWVLNKYDGKTFTEILIKNSKDPFTNQIFGATEDKNGNIWIGTANGVCRYDGRSFEYFRDSLPQ